MKTYTLHFGVIIILKNNLAEIVINQGVVMDLKMVELYHAFLLEKLDTPFSLLINKKYSYTYVFEAQKNIVNIPEVKAIAVVAHAYVSRLATDVLININRNENRNIKVFSKREEALNWLEFID